MVEVLVVVAIVGILTAIASLGFSGWSNRLRVNAAQSTALTAIRDAQTLARQRKSPWSISFKPVTVDKKPFVQWAIHPGPTINEDDKAWRTIDGVGITIDDNSSDSPGGTGTESKPWTVQFDYKGNVAESGVGAIITLIPANNPSIKRCVKIKTILGALSSEADEKCKQS